MLNEFFFAEILIYIWFSESQYSMIVWSVLQSWQLNFKNTINLIYSWILLAEISLVLSKYLSIENDSNF